MDSNDVEFVNEEDEERVSWTVMSRDCLIWARRRFLARATRCSCVSNSSAHFLSVELLRRIIIHCGYIIIRQGAVVLACARAHLCQALLSSS